ncbi:MAG TPA: glycosyltransferase family 2 protein [Ohtaekwangia sp.]
MDVSIVIINYNTFTLTSQCIESIVKNTTGISLEIILVDNASTEVSADTFLEKYPFIILIKNPVNSGFAKGNNLGIEKAKGRFVLLLNSDTILKNNVALILMQFLEKHPPVAAVSARLEYPDGSVQHCCQRFPSVFYQLFELLRLQKILPRKTGNRILMGAFFKHDTVAYPDWIWGTCFMFRRDLLKELPNNKLADDFFMYGEDMQWCMEFRRIGYTVAFQPTAVVIHFMGKSGGAKSGMMEQHGERFLKLYYSFPHRFVIKGLMKILQS